MARPCGLPKGIRLRSKREIAEVFQKGNYHALGVLHAKTLRTELEETRFLISVKRAIGNAPSRNRIKRLVRETIRLHRHELAQPHDICFFLTSKPQTSLTLSAIEAEFKKLIKRLSEQR